MSGVKLPRLCGSVTVRTAATIRAASPTAFTAGVPVGRYWFDPVYAGNQAADSISAIGQLAYRIDLADATAAYSCDYSRYILTELQKSINGWYAILGSPNMELRTTDALTNDAGRAFLRAFGLPTAQVIPTTGSGEEDYGGLPIWDPAYGEAGNLREADDGFAALFKTRGRSAYTSNLGTELPKRLLEFQLLPGGQVNQTRTRGVYGANAPVYGSAVASASDYSLQWIWRELLSKGELVRYYADRTATQTYVTAAVLATDATVTVNSATGLAANQLVWLDGELMMITLVAGLVLTVERSEPVAHPKYAPLSRDFVGTYALDEGGGDVNLRTFTPRQRTVRADFWDLSIPLVRAVWS